MDDNSAYIELLTKREKLYFNTHFTLDMVANWSINKCIKDGNDCIHSEMACYINNVLRNRIEAISKVGILFIDNTVFEKGNNKYAIRLYFVELAPDENDTHTLIKEIDCKLSSGCRDIAQECIVEAGTYLDKKILELQRENQKKVLSGALT